MAELWNVNIHDDARLAGCAPAGSVGIARLLALVQLRMSATRCC
jgi:hypothetical protein